MQGDHDQEEQQLGHCIVVETDDALGLSIHIRTQKLILNAKCKELLRLSPIKIPLALASHAHILEPVLKMNRLVLAHRASYPTERKQISIDDSSAFGGTICTDLEFVLFGIWLRIDQQPGLATSSGPAANENTILKTVATAAALVWRAKPPKPSDEVPNQKPTKKKPARITATKVRDRWHIMHGEFLDQAVFRSRLRTAERYLRAYLTHLKRPPTATTASDQPKRVVRSPHLEKVLAAMSPRARS